MIRRFSQNILAILIGIIVSGAILLFISSVKEADNRSILSNNAAQIQSALILQFNETALFADHMATEIAYTIKNDSSDLGSAPFSNSDFTRVTHPFWDQNPYIRSMIYVKNKSNEMQSLSLKSDHTIRISRGNNIANLVLEHITAGDGDSVEEGLRVQSGKAPQLFTYRASQNALVRAVTSGDTTLSEAMIENNNRIEVLHSTPINAPYPRFIWFYKSVYAGDRLPENESQRVAQLLGVVGIAFDLSKLNNANRLENIADTSLFGPVLLSDIKTILPKEQPFRILKDWLSQAFGQSEYSIKLPVPIGKYGFQLVATIPEQGILGLEFEYLAGALLIGFFTAFGVVAVMYGERKRAEYFSRRSQSTLRKIENKQRQLRASQDRFKHLAESTNVIPWAADMQTQRFTYVGPQVEQLTGYPVETWYAEGFWVHHIHPQDRHKALVEGVAGLREGKYATREYRIRAANGRVLHIRNMLTLIPQRSRTDGQKSTLAQGFLIDITEMKLAQSALEVARRQAEQANRTKSEFLANMSHELRTPLNAVIGFSEIMKEGIFGPLDDRYAEYAGSIHSSGKHLLDLINDVLDLSKIEAGRVELTEEETDIGMLIANCKTLLHERATSAGLHIRLETIGVLPSILADERRLKQILLNLISNSIKFTPPGGSVTIIGEVQRGRGLRIAVQDSGIGMSDQELPRALEKFGQIDGELARQHDGTGLGLPIAKSLAEMHGGSLELVSKKGQGTTVSIWLPENRFIFNNVA